MIYIILMKCIHSPYMKEFIQFSQANFDTRSPMKTISGFAFLMTGKANQLIKRAKSISGIDLPKFRKELSDAGCMYIRKFGNRGRAEAGR